MGFELSGAIALVTGANRGIGKVIVETLLQHGAGKVYAAVRNPASVTDLQATYGDRLVPLELDLSRPETIKAAARLAPDVQLVVSNAGVLRSSTPFSDDFFDNFRFELDVNVFGLVHMAQSFAPILRSNGGGAFVQLNSVASLKSFADFSSYCASKAAAYSLTQALRDLLREQGTQVISVHPGPIATDMAVDAGLSEMADSPQTVADGIVSALQSGVFHVFPDAMARQFGEAYHTFAQTIIDAQLLEA